MTSCTYYVTTPVRDRTCEQITTAKTGIKKQRIESPNNKNKVCVKQNTLYVLAKS